MYFNWARLELRVISLLVQLATVAVCFRWVFQFADEKVLKQPAVHLHRGQTVCQSLFSEKPAPLSNYRRQKNYTAAV